MLTVRFGAFWPFKPATKKTFSTKSVRPRYPSATPTEAPSIEPVPHPTVAVVLQGPVMKAFDFTIETAKFYRNMWDSMQIVVSTWDTEVCAHLRALESQGITVVTAPLPEFSGPSNANYQAVSANVGVLAAKELGATHVLKSRTDQRIYNPASIDLMLDLISAFPLAQEASGSQKERVITISLNTFAKRLYGVTDMMQFGLIDDVLQYWNGKGVPLRSSGGVNGFASNAYDFASDSPETYFCSSFLENTGWALSWTLDDSLSAMAKRFLVVDSAQVELFWPKYSRLENRYSRYVASSQFEELTFASWLRLWRTRG